MTLPTGPDATALACAREGGARAARTGGSVLGVQDGRTVIALCLVGMVVVGQLYTALPLLGRFARSWSVTPGAAAWTATAFSLGTATVLCGFVALYTGLQITGPDAGVGVLLGFGAAATGRSEKVRGGAQN